MADAADRSLQILTAVDERRRRAATKALDVSLNELATMYEDGDLIIRPEFQRLFRWSAAKQSQLIESLVLEMPVPPIFVIEQEEGKWELIDGLQRLSTYLHFRGELNAPEREPAIAPGQFLRLEDCDILPELNGLLFSDLPTQLQIRLKRSFFRVEMVRRETNPQFRYYMFKRLNTGGELLSDQEVRNCTLRLLDGGSNFNEFLKSLSRWKSFQEVIDPLTREKRQKMVDVELVLRFLAFHFDFESFSHDVGPFLTEFMERVADSTHDKRLLFDYGTASRTFEKTFTVLAKTLGPSTCLRWMGSRFGGGFSNHHFEAFSLGVARVVDQIRDGDDGQLARVAMALDAVKKDAEFGEMVKGGGQNSKGLYRNKIDRVVDGLRPVL